MSSLTNSVGNAVALKFSKSELDSMAQFAKGLQLDGYQISVYRSQGFDISTTGLELESIEHTNDCECNIKVFKDQKIANATTSALNLDAMQSCLQHAAAQVDFTSQDASNLLPDPSLQTGKLADCDLYHPCSLSVDAAIEQALKLAKLSDAIYSDVRAESTNVSRTEFVYELIDSNGFYGAERTTRHSSSVQMIAGSGDAMQTDSEYTLARSVDDLLPVEQLAKLAADKTKARLNPRSLKSQQLPVMLMPDIAAGFWGHLIAAISGGALIKQASFLQDKLNQLIAPKWLNIIQQPHIAGAIGSSAFDSEGVITSERAIIADGVLNSFILSTYTAHKLGLKTTANAGGIQNLVIDASADDDFQSMLNKLHTGVLVTDLMGQGIDIVTGNYSRGAAGFWVENGVIKYPIHEFTIAGNLSEMLQKIVATGADIDTRRKIRCGPLLFESLQLAGN